MKRIVAILLAFVMVMAFATVSMAAGWDKCKMCHKEDDKPMVLGGKSVPTKADLLKKFKTAADFKKASKDAKDPLMTPFKGDADVDTAVKYLGLK
ncbi:MAG: hypothetical protein A2Z09_00615 [Nitrospirae bacterium RBG_16_43_8]|nr:MAG: hypothetical protein A2Z09_00615 [Nitrospirae bacterium RBG_16_43_8]